MTTTSTASAECGDPDVTIGISRKTTPLSLFAAPLTTEQRLQRTLDYIKAPEEYLRRTLGEKAFQEQRHSFRISSTYDQDVYGSAGHKTQFEQHIARFLGKEHGLFFVTGIQAQLAALKVHCTRAKNNKVAWHVSSHLEDAEESAYRELFGLQRVLIGEDAKALPAVHEVERVIIEEKPAAILLELPARMLGCVTYTFAELDRIAELCRKYGVALHLDGARLWDILPYYEESAKNGIADLIRLFDTIYVSFYKGLGGVTGAILVTNDKELMLDAKVWQRRAGGNAYTLVYETIDCERGFNENIGTFGTRWKKMLEVTDAIRAATSSFKTSDGDNIISFSPELPVCGQARTVLSGFSANELYRARDVVKHNIGIIVFDKLKPEFSLDEKLAAERAGKLEQLAKEAEADKHHEFEWLMNSVNMALDQSVFVSGYVSLCQELLSKQ